MSKISKKNQSAKKEVKPDPVKDKAGQIAEFKNQVKLRVNSKRGSILVKS